MQYEDGCLNLINQLKLPFAEEWVKCTTVEEVSFAIRDMVVRGAPAIGCAAGFAFHIDIVRHAHNFDIESYKTRFAEVCRTLGESRPTAVNLFYAIDLFKAKFQSYNGKLSYNKIYEDFHSLAMGMFNDDLTTCQKIGEVGLSEAKAPKVNVLTHCNTGSLATAGYGTALGVIRSLHQAGRLGDVYMDETRPYLQGSRLTAFELQKDNIPATLICDSVAATLMAQGKVDFIVVGADRIAANGDTANKIGTYSLAVNAYYHKVPFYIAAPLSTFDINIASGADIPIELRPDQEVVEVFGKKVAAEGTRVYNPSFDVTPGTLIAGIITERGVLKPPYNKSISEVLS